MEKPKNFDNVPESDCIINYVADRHKKGLYTLSLVTGLPGTGKSSSCLRLGELISEKIHGKNILDDSCVVDSLLQLLRKIKKIEKPGEIIVIEEVSVLFPSRRAMASENVAIGRILDTCRKKQVILLANAPVFTSIDSHIRALGHILIETQRIYKTHEVVVSKAWKLQTNAHTGKTYRHRFRRKGRDVNLFITRKPNSELWDAYEKNKDAFLDNLYQRLEKQTAKKQEKEDKKLGITRKRKVKKDLTEQEIKVHKLRNIDGLKYKEIASKLSLSVPRIHYIVKNIKKKTELLRN